MNAWDSLDQLLVALGAVIGVIGGLWIKNKRNDNSIQKYIIDTVRRENQEANLEIKQVKQAYQEFQKLHEATVRKLNEQIGLKEEENQRLRTKIAQLEKENETYHAKYGTL